MRNKCIIPITVLLLLALLLSSGIAQEKTTKGEKQRPPLSVKLSVVVTDANYQPVNDVTKDRLRIFEDDVPQPLSSFEEKAKLPGFVLAIDMSASLRGQVSTVLATANLIVKSTLPDEKVMLMRFISSNKIEKAQDFTSDHLMLLKAIDDLYLEGGQSAVIDAISVANDSIEQFTKDKGDVRRPLIFITDGEDRQSYYTTKQLLERLRKTGAQVLVIAFQQGLQPQRAKERAMNLLNQLAQETGGNVYYPTSITDLERDVKQMMLEMRASYVVGYESTNPTRDGKFRKVRVEVESPADGPRRLAFVRDGYTAPKN